MKWYWELNPIFHLSIFLCQTEQALVFVKNTRSLAEDHVRRTLFDPKIQNICFSQLSKSSWQDLKVKRTAYILIGQLHSIFNCYGCLEMLFVICGSVLQNEWTCWIISLCYAHRTNEYVFLKPNTQPPAKRIDLLWSKFLHRVTDTRSIKEKEIKIEFWQLNM